MIIKNNHLEKDCFFRKKTKCRICNKTIILGSFHVKSTKIFAKWHPPVTDFNKFWHTYTYTGEMKNCKILASWVKYFFKYEFFKFWAFSVFADFQFWSIY